MSDHFSAPDWKVYFKLAQNGIYFFDPETLSIDGANQVLCHMLGYRGPEEILGHSVLSLSTTPEKELRPLIRKALDSGVWPQSIKRRLLRKDGSHLQARLDYSIMPFGQTSKVVVHARDMGKNRNIDVVKGKGCKT